MDFKEVGSLIAGIIILAGFAYIGYRGDSYAKVIGASGDALASTIVAATPRT